MSTAPECNLEIVDILSVALWRVGVTTCNNCFATRGLRACVREEISPRGLVPDIVSATESLERWLRRDIYE